MRYGDLRREHLLYRTNLACSPELLQWYEYGEPCGSGQYGGTVFWASEGDGGPVRSMQRGGLEPFPRPARGAQYL